VKPEILKKPLIGPISKLRSTKEALSEWVNAKIDTAITNPTANTIEILYSIGTMWTSNSPRLDTWKSLNYQMPKKKGLQQVDLEREFRSRQSDKEKQDFEIILLDKATEAILSARFTDNESKFRTLAYKKGLILAQAFLSARLSDPNLLESDRIILQNRNEHVSEELKKLNLRS
jgi:hypothetical protein